MKLQIFYLAGMLITMFLAYKVMSKVKDTPKEEECQEPVELEEPEETAFGIKQNESDSPEDGNKNL